MAQNRASAMRFLNNLQIVLKVGLIVAVLGCALLGACAANLLLVWYWL